MYRQSCSHVATTHGRVLRRQGPKEKVKDTTKARCTQRRSIRRQPSSVAQGYTQTQQLQFHLDCARQARAQAAELMRTTPQNGVTAQLLDAAFTRCRCPCPSFSCPSLTSSFPCWARRRRPRASARACSAGQHITAPRITAQSVQRLTHPFLNQT